MTRMTGMVRAIGKVVGIAFSVVVGFLATVVTFMLVTGLAFGSPAPWWGIVLYAGLPLICGTVSALTYLGLVRVGRSVARRIA